MCLDVHVGDEGVDISSEFLISVFLSSVHKGITRKNPRTPLSDLQGTNALNEKASW